MAAETNKKVPAVQKKEKASFGEYLKGVRVEMKKVIWPSRKELGSFTAVVIVTCVFFALAFWGIDSAVLAGLRGILGITI